MADIVERLRIARQELHVLEMAAIASKNRSRYSRWGSAMALALIEIESLRSALSDTTREKYVGSDDDSPPDDCGFRIDNGGGLHCLNVESGQCAECPVGRDFDIEDIDP